jgi:putative tricarboxylic transport membrane protein
MILLQHPGSAVMIGIAVIALLAPFLFKGLARFRQDED